MSNIIYVRENVVSSGLILADDTKCFVYGGGTILDTTANASAQVTLIGGSASATQITDGAKFTARQKGFVSNTVVSSGGEMYVSGGATAIQTQFLAGASGYVSANMQDVTICSGALLSIDYGANVSDLKIESGGKIQLRVAEGISVSGTSGGIPLTVSNATLSDYTMTSGSLLVLDTGASASDIGIESGASLHVNAGACVNGLHIDEDVDNCSYYLDSKSVFLNCDYGGKVFSMQNGLLSGLYVPAEGTLQLSSGVIADDIVYEGLEMVVNEGAVVKNSYINDRIAEEDMNGLISSCTLGSEAYVGLAGGTMTDIVLESGARLYANGGILAGKIQVGGTLYLKKNAEMTSDSVLVFDISGRSAGGKLLVSSFQYASFSDYDLLIAAKQTTGVYVLANGVSAFTGPLSVSMDGDYLGELTVDGKKLLTRSGYYALSLDSDSQLYITVTDGYQIVYTNNAWTDLDDGTEVQVTSSVTAVIGRDAYADYESALCHVAYGGTIYNCGNEKAVFEGDVTEVTIRENCYVNGSDIALVDLIVGGTVFCGDDASQAYSEKTINATDVTAKRIFAAGYAENAQQTQTTDITMNVQNGSFTAGVFGGAEISNSLQTTSTLDYKTELSISGTTAGLVFGNCNMKSTASSPYTAVVNASVDITLNDVYCTNYVAGGSLIGSYTREERSGDTVLNIVGGTYRTAVLGGSLVQSSDSASCSMDGNISISVSGNASLSTLFGANGALKVGATKKTELDGDVTITFDITDGATVEKYIVLGGMAKSRVDGDVKMIFTGHSEQAALASVTVIGGSSYATWGESYVTGERSLVFSDFQGNLAANVALFTNVTIDSDSCVEFSYCDNFNSVEEWNIQGRSGQTSALFSQGFISDFSAVTFHLECEFEEDSSWTIIKSTSAEDFNNIANAFFYLNDEELFQEDEFIFESENYRIELQEDGALVASKLA